MIKKCLLILLLLMMPGSVVCASLIQIQGMGFTADNTVGRGGGIGFGGGSQAVGSNIINVSNNNRTVDMFGPTLALQDENATLVQTGWAAGVGGRSQTGQTASMIGLQGQAAANRGSLGAQGQILNANLGNTGNQQGGVGGAVGSQYFTGTQNQSLFLPGQTTFNTQTVEVMQYSNVSGSSPGTNASVNSNANVTAGQGQIVLRGSIF